MLNLLYFLNAENLLIILFNKLDILYLTFKQNF